MTGTIQQKTAQIMVVDDVIVQVYGNQVVKLHKETGEKLWGAKVPAASSPRRRWMNMAMSI